MYFSRLALPARHVCPGAYKSTLSYFKTHPNLQASSAPRHLTLDLDSVFLLYVNAKVVVLKIQRQQDRVIVKGISFFSSGFFLLLYSQYFFFKNTNLRTKPSVVSWLNVSSFLLGLTVKAHFLRAADIDVVVRYICESVWC